jgi:hypothetical protein
VVAPSRHGYRTHRAVVSGPESLQHFCILQMSTDTDKSLLDILEAHGQKFLDSFKPHRAEENGRKRAAEDTAESHRSTKLLRAETDLSESSPVDDCSDSAEEWTGLGDDAQVHDEYEVYSSAEEAVPLEGALCQSLMAKLTDSDTTERMLIASTSTHKPDVVIFSGTGPKTSEPLSKKLQGKAFMVRSFLLSRGFHLTSPQVF